MLNEKQIIKIKTKMIKKNINSKKLSKTLECSNATLSIIFNRKKDLPKIEKKLIEWLKNSEN